MHRSLKNNKELLKSSQHCPTLIFHLKLHICTCCQSSFSQCFQKQYKVLVMLKLLFVSLSFPYRTNPHRNYWICHPNCIKKRTNPDKNVLPVYTEQKKNPQQIFPAAFCWNNNTNPTVTRKWTRVRLQRFRTCRCAADINERLRRSAYAQQLN